jgi:hypothetical protein
MYKQVKVIVHHRICQNLHTAKDTYSLQLITPNPLADILNPEPAPSDP